MIQSILLGVALTAAAASAETATISECTTNFDNGAETADPASTEFCSLLQNFAACLALAPVGGRARRPLPNWAYRPNLNMAQAQPNRFQIGLNWAWLGAANRIGCSGAVASAFFLGVD